MGGRSSTVQQMTNRVQGLKRHLNNNKNVGQTNVVDVSKILSSQQKRNQMKFTAAGYPVHDYIKEMREEREMTEYKKAM